MITCNSSIDFDKLLCGCFKSRVDLWILDSGATHHMTFNKDHLSDIITLPYPLLVKLPNGYKVKVTEIENVKLATMITLYKVLFIPSFKYNLISISSLAIHLKCIASFEDSSCVLQGPSLQRPLEIGRVQDGLYFLCSGCLQKNNSSCSSAQCFSFHSDRIGCQCKCFSHSCSVLPIVKYPIPNSFHSSSTLPIVRNPIASDSTPSVMTTIQNNRNSMVDSIHNVSQISTISHEVDTNLIWHTDLGMSLL